MTFDELTDPLPWGLHDAYLESMEIDWIGSRLLLTARLMMTEHQDMDQRARITVTGLVFVTISPPTELPDPALARRNGGIWIDDSSKVLDEAVGRAVRAAPDGCFSHCIYLRDRNSIISFCGRSAELEWLEPVPVPSRARSRAAFPGEESF